MRNLLILPALTLAAVTVATASFAGDALVNVPRDQWMPIQQLNQTLTTQGYNVHEVESDDGVYEVEATGRDGKRVDMKVHPATGEILFTELDDD